MVSHISRKTSEMWGTRPSLRGGDERFVFCLLGRKMAAKSARTKPLDPLELTIEVGVVAEANLKADFEHAPVGFDQ